MPSLKALPDAEERVSNAVFLTHGRAASRSGGMRQMALAHRGLRQIPNLEPQVRPFSRALSHGLTIKLPFDRIKGSAWLACPD